MGLHRVEDTGQYIGRNLTFKIIEYGKKGRNIIVSNRTVLEEERQEQKDALRETLRASCYVGVFNISAATAGFVRLAPDVHWHNNMDKIIVTHELDHTRTARCCGFQCNLGAVRNREDIQQVTYVKGDLNFFAIHRSV